MKPVLRVGSWALIGLAVLWPAANVGWLLAEQKRSRARISTSEEITVSLNGREYRAEPGLLHYDSNFERLWLFNSILGAIRFAILLLAASALLDMASRRRAAP
ncbi:MAG: hypothetical protein AAGD14_11730 [Planctomycetota bacterium]